MQMTSKTQSKSKFVPSPIAAEMIAGGLGGTLAAVITCPLEVVKTRLQSGNYVNSPALASQRFKAWFLLKEIVAKEGYRALFKGVSANLIGVAPSRACYFGFYSEAKRAFLSTGMKETPLTFCLSACTAGVLTSTITNPIWLVKTRIQLQNTALKAAPIAANGGSLPVTNYNYSGITDAVAKIWRQEGAAGFFKGVTASYFGVVETALHWMIYESLKQRAKSSDSSGTVQASQVFVFSAFSKLTASLVAYPHEVVRTRMRECRVGESKYTSVIPSLIHIAKFEGRRGLYAGLGPHLIRTVPNAAIMFATFEFTKNALQQ